MDKDSRNALIALPFILLIAVGFAVAGSDGQTNFAGLSSFAVVVALAFIVQWIAFVPAYWKQTEMYFDLVGSGTYVSATLLALALSPSIDLRTSILAGMVLLWAIRLGGFLFARIHKSGKDGRFDSLKTSFVRFLAAWTLQGLWVTFTAAAALAAITAENRVSFGLYAGIGSLLWLVGFSIEAIADLQKKRFKADENNRGKFISTGLWSCSRHPNYFGEIVLWIGVAIVAFPVLQGWQLVTLTSPLWVTLLLVKVSGIPLLESRSDEKWGGDEDYEAYKRRTPVLLLKIW